MFLRLLRLCCCGFLVLSLASSPAFSQGKGKGKGHNKDAGDDDQGPGKGKRKAKHEFDSHDREVITTYYSNGNSNLPPGLQKRVQPCPVELERRLPPLEPGYTRGVIGAHIVIYNQSTSVIVDIVKNVVH